jgi:hypothetical protein
MRRDVLYTIEIEDPRVMSTLIAMQEHLFSLGYINNALMGAG